MNRRQFLGSTLSAGAAIAAGPLSARASETHPAAENEAIQHGQIRTLPIGVFNLAFNGLPLDDMLDKFASLGIEAVEVGAGGYATTSQCPTAELLADAAKARAWKKKFEDRGLRVLALSCHANALYPDPIKAGMFAEQFRQTIELAGMLEIPTVVGFSGCPGASPTDVTPNWIAWDWPPEYSIAREWQWKERVIPYWKETVKFAREHGVHRIALEMEPNFVVYNPRTLLRLRDAVGEEIGANCDLSHLFWQQCDGVEVIRLLGKHGALYHAHMKDTVLFPLNVARYGVLNFGPKTDTEGSGSFRAVGYGHGANFWKDVVAAYMDVGYDGMLSIENEDPLLSAEVGVEKALALLKAVRAELLTTGPNPGS